MKNKAILVSIVALFAIVLTLSAVIASDVDITIEDVEVNDISVISSTAAGFVSENVPVEVEFTANEDLEDVRVKVYIEGYRDEVSDSTSRFRVVNGSTYLKRFSLDLPSSFDLDDDPEDLTILVRISAKGKDSFEEIYNVRMQRESYTLSILSIEADDKVSAGSVLALDVVVKNFGSDRLDDTYVRASIPELGISKRIYFGDIESETDEDYDQIRDTINKRIYLTIPTNSISGVYNVEVEAYNFDSIVTASKKVIISGVNSDSIDDVDVVDSDDNDSDSNNAVLILTVILAIIFVVLLVVLIVLLTKKPAEIEEFGETSYY
tara:strand:+ start:5173 stop:6135 length:963 start_codon:yes stop_codon:yes gene_type:complete